MRTVPTIHLRRLAVIAVLASLAIGAFFAQPKLTAPSPGKPPSMTLTTPNQPSPTAEGQPTATVTPGPAPWYTLFSTGEVVGYIEPCG